MGGVLSSLLYLSLDNVMKIYLVFISRKFITSEERRRRGDTITASGTYRESYHSAEGNSARNKKGRYYVQRQRQIAREIKRVGITYRGRDK